MLWLKSCPRCHEDLCESKDMYGRYINGIQCGHYVSASQELALRDPSRRVTPDDFEEATYVPPVLVEAS